jgi:hypothetical protein
MNGVFPEQISNPATCHVSYAEHVTEVFEQWSLLTNDSAHALDPRAVLLKSVLTCRRGDHDCHSAERLCADGSPVEFCERLARTPQRPAYTLDLGPNNGSSGERLEFAFSLLKQVVNPDAVSELWHRLADHISYVRAVWIGVDCETSGGVRLYLELARKIASTAAAVTFAAELAGMRIDERGTLAINDIAARGTLRLVGIDLGRPSAGLKLAFALPLSDSLLVEHARRFDFEPQLFSTYVHCVASKYRLWRQARCGLGIRFDSSGKTRALTLYHYAAPYFRDDDELRSRVFTLAAVFGWSTATYRATSRLLDFIGVRVRNLLGFTVKDDGITSLRIYGCSGHLA